VAAAATLGAAAVFTVQNKQNLKRTIYNHQFVNM